MAENKTVQQEMEALGIEPKHFDTLYDELKKSQRLPSGDIVPWNQYTAIVGYLRDKQVLGEDSKIQPDGMKVFDKRRNIETILVLDDVDDNPDSIGVKSSGGILPCKYERDPSRRGGGVLPCRYD